MSWPNRIPSDLRRRIDAVLSMRNSDANEIWTELREWLIQNGLESPDFPVDPSRETDWETMHNDDGRAQNEITLD